MENLFYPPSLRRLGSVDELYVLSIDNPAPRHAARLPSAEREVVHALLQGRSNDEIARLRRTSAKTVANQLARLFERFGVHSRTELVRALERSPRSE